MCFVKQVDIIPEPPFLRSGRNEKSKLKPKCLNLK